VGPVDEREVVEVFLRHLYAEKRNRLMADVWRKGDTVRLVRREPHMTAAGKILPLHITDPEGRAGQRSL
jgi:hypothetical protein